MFKSLAIFFTTASFWGMSAQVQELQQAVSTATIEHKAVVLRALDKITARTVEIEVRVGTEFKFGTLNIKPLYCRTRPPEEQPETFSYLDIYDINTDKSQRRIFSGWMMASNPAINALEHPVYDIWVINCKIVSAGVSSSNK
ncbi:DUF2155 domain-containing protein [Temperatibacter marinus]|uniref:DUF2155 domain-containing protein n=1 Tax=Temperatibacter marinus TaxID=1456591 RepID=A0AA52EGW3_9PROT|nr:DUF2155 domain-containing protein [Temperatibacter marinus]WND02292.1 DUF2155 domain-containing protein [Temperatibacter marinus]